MRRFIVFILVFILVFIFVGPFAESQTSVQTQSQPQSQTQPQTQEAPPSTDIFLATLKMQNGKPAVEEPVNITKRPGYDNQPFFMPSGKELLYTSIRNGDQADIYRYDLVKGTETAFTNTPESEYSPTLTPDNRFISVVRVEADKKQHLWRYPLSNGKPEMLIPTVEPVGYHCWLSTNTVVVFVLGEPPTLQIASLKGDKPQVIAKNIGRTLRMIPGRHSLSYILKDTEKIWSIQEYDPSSGKSTTIIKTLPEVEDFAWMPDGTLLSGKGSKLFYFKPGRDSDWIEFADLAAQGIKDITRLSVSPHADRLALVSVF